MHQYNHHPVVCFGETLWDMLPSGKQAGGAPVNVAYHLHKHGKNPAIVSKVGFDELGKQLIETLAAKDVCTDYFQIDYEKLTSVVKVSDRSEQKIVYNILEDVAWDYIEPGSDLAPLVQQAEYFVFGSLVARSKKSFTTLLGLLDVAHTKVLGLNLRAPFYNRELMEILLKKTDILKVSLDELELVTGWFSQLQSETDRIQLLKDRFQLRAVILTRGAKGAIINIKDEWCKHQGLRIRVVDTVGSGDAFLAAFISKQLEGKGIDETLQYANQLAAFVTTKKGACPDYTLNEVDALTGSFIPKSE